MCFSKCHLAANKFLYISQEWYLHFAEHTWNGVRGKGRQKEGGALAENIRNIEEFVDKQWEEVCLSVFIAFAGVYVCVWKVLAWQTLSLTAYDGHFGELGIKQWSPQHREIETVTRNPQVCLYSLHLSSPESEWPAHTGLVAWGWGKGQSAEGGSKCLRFSLSQGMDKTDGPLRRSRLVSLWEGAGVCITVQLWIRLYLWFSHKKLF